ncbi:MAG: serine/threonine protein kinase, partial [Bdellovibrionales bacterium]|nr:serine/threonine protein kinase [Bdellovibrionales bacterium]
MNLSPTLFFYNLTPEKILTSVEEMGVRCTGRALALNSMENRVYEVEIEAGEETSFLIAKYYRPFRWSNEQILEEHQFLKDLANAEIPVISPQEFPDNSTLKKLDEEIYFAIFPKAVGRSIDELDPMKLEQIGRLLARLHLIGETKTAPHRLSLNPNTYGRENLKFIMQTCKLPIGIVDRFSDAVNFICDKSDPWFDNSEHQRIHGDCHLGNILWSGPQC